MDPALSELAASSLMQALQGGDEAALSLSIEAAAEAAKVDQIQMFTQRGQYTRRLLDELGETALRDAAIALENSHPRAFAEVQELREDLRQRARDRVERAYLVHAAGDTEDFLDSALAEVRLANISPHQMARMRRLIDRMARKLASDMAAGADEPEGSTERARHPAGGGRQWRALQHPLAAHQEEEAPGFICDVSGWPPMRNSC